MRLLIRTRPPEHMPREIRNITNLQQSRPLHQDVKSRNATPRTTENTKQKHHTNNTYQYNNNQNNTRRIRNINTTPEDNTSQVGSTRSCEDESVDPESTCYIREIMEDWNTINLIKNWTETRINKINNTNIGEFWIETHAGQTKLQWLVGTGSPRSFISQSTAEQLTAKLGKTYRRKQPKWANSDVSTTKKYKESSKLISHQEPAPQETAKF